MSIAAIDRARGGPSIVVVGGGIAGLAAAHALVRAAPAATVTVVEADGRLGGKIVTERVDGFVVEGGPDSFLAAKPRGVGLCAEVGLDDRLLPITPQPHRAYVARGGRLHGLPAGLSGLVPTQLGSIARSGLLSPVGKARLALDFILPPRAGEGDESLGAFVRRRLGREAYERLVEPLMAGIYAGDGDRLSLAATFPQLRAAEREHGGLIRGVLANRAAAAAGDAGAPPRPAFLSLHGGLGELVAALASSLRDGGVVLRTGVPVVDVTARSGAVAVGSPMIGASGAAGASGVAGSWDREGGRAESSPARGTYAVRLGDGEVLPADAVVVAAPAFAAGDLLAAIAPVLAAELRAIPHASSAIVSLAYRRDDVPHPLAAHGYVVPRAEGGPVLACTWSSQKWAGRAPAGHVLLRVFLGRWGQDEVLAGDDAALVAIARAEVGRRLGAAAAPTSALVHRWPRGMPQYVLGHPERLRRIEAALATHPALALAGNAYRGVGIPDCIASGEAAAAGVLAALGLRPPHAAPGLPPRPQSWGSRRADLALSTRPSSPIVRRLGNRLP